MEDPVEHRPPKFRETRNGWLEKVVLVTREGFERRE